jgi:hypothetical protein
VSGTNNIAELLAAITGMETIKALDLRNVVVELVSDSMYVLDLASGAKSPTANMELANRLIALANELQVTVRWVKGHSGNPVQELTDSMAKAERNKFLGKLPGGGIKKIKQTLDMLTLEPALACYGGTVSTGTQTTKKPDKESIEEYRKRVAHGWYGSGVSQGEYAKRFGVTARTIRVWMRVYGRVENPTREIRKKLQELGDVLYGLERQLTPENSPGRKMK